MAEEETPDPFDPRSRELPTIEELERELAMHVPEAVARIVEDDPRKMALQALRHLDYKLRRAYELHLGLSGKSGPMPFSEIADYMAISKTNAQRLFKRAGMHLGPHTLPLEKMAEDIQKAKTHTRLDLGSIAVGLSPQEFEALEMIDEGRTWAEVGNELGIGGLAGARQLRGELAERIGIEPNKVDELVPDLVRLYIEGERDNK